MLLAMGFLSFLCILLGVHPKLLYNILPFEVNYTPYTLSHVLSQLQILIYSAAAFFLMLPMLKRTDTITLDTDWFYRKGSTVFLRLVDKYIIDYGEAFKNFLLLKIPEKFSYIF